MIERYAIANEVLLGEVCAMLESGKRVKLRAKGGSMSPAIRGDEDTILLVPAKALRKGDVVLARTVDNRYVVHRIVHIDGEMITLAGDANLYGREYCKRADVAGIAEAVIRGRRVRSLSGFRSRMWASLRQFLMPFRRGGSKIRSYIRRVKK